MNKMNNKNNNNLKPFDSDEENDDFLKYCCPSASWGDMTGLIPYSVESSGDLQAYNELYPYLPDSYNKL